MNAISSHLDAILFGLICIVAWVSYRIGRASAQDEINATLKEVDSLREVIHQIKDSRDLSRGNNHPAGIRLVRN